MSQVDPTVSLDEPQRQSLLAVVFLAIRVVRGIGLVQLGAGIVFVVSQSPSVFVLIGAAFVFGLIAFGLATLSWWRYTFMVNNGELVVTRGVLSQDRLTVPLDRVQSVSIEQKPLHRLVGLVQVSLDTAGASEAEFTIDAVERPVAVALQRVTADYRTATQVEVDEAAAYDTDADGAPLPPPPQQPDRVVLQHDAKRLVLIALTQMPLSGLAVIAPLFAFGDSIFERVPFDLPEVDFEVGAWLLWFVPVAILGVVVFSTILNLASTLLSDWNLTITSTSAGLRRDAGLLSTTSRASSIPRVQRVSIDQGPIERLVGIRTTTLHTLGEGDFVVPGCTEAQALELRSIALDESDGVEVLDRRVSPAQVFKDVRNASVFFGLLALGLWFPLGWWSLLFLVFILTTWLTSRRQTRLRRWGVAADSIADRREFVGWRVDEALLRKANGVSVRQSLFERKRGLATVHVRLAGSTVAIGMLPLDEARAIRDRALYVAETDRRAFM